MPKFISGTCSTLLNQETATEPLILIQINLGGGIRYYCERELSEDEGFPCSGKILSISQFTYQKKADSFGASGSVTISIDDGDGSIKFAYDNTSIEQKPIAAYIYYPGTSLNDSLPLLIGKIAGPVSWSEGQRVISFNIETEVQSREIGFAPTSDDFEDLSQDAYEIPWPMIFGKCAHVPTVKAKAKTRGFLKTDAKLKSDIYKVDADGKVITFADKCTVDSYLRDEDGNIITQANTFYIQDGEKFPSGQIKILIDNVVFEGSFSDNNDPTKFTVKEANVAKYNGIEVGARKTVADNEDEYKILWLQDESVQIAGMHCYFRPNQNIEWGNLCVRQEGTKCYFANRFLDPKTGTKIKIDSRYNFSAYGTFINGLHRDRNEQDVATAFKYINLFTNADDKNGLLNWAKEHLTRIAGVGNAFMEFPTNEEVRLWDQNDPDIYVVSLAKCQSVDAIYGRRTHKFSDGKTRQTFEPIPKSWYTIQLESNYNLDSGPVTTIQMNLPLEDRNTESSQWDDVLYVTATSTIGPNISDIIKWILQKYTDLIIDPFSFNEVKALVDSRPANFMINNQDSALKIAEDLAWQAACVLIVDSGVAYLKYLPKEPDPILVLNNDSIQLKSIEELSTDINDIKTKLIVSWYENFRATPIPSPKHSKEFEELLRQILPEFNRKIEGLKIYTYKNNIDQHGEIKDDRQIRIYNDEDYVKHTIDFWGGRYSNIWRRIKLKTFIHTMILQPFDCILLQIAGKLNYNSPAIIESITYDHNEKDVTLELWLPIKVGFGTIAQEAWTE